MSGFEKLASVCVLACLAFAAPLSAQQRSSDEQARLHYQVAASYFEQADYESALREFQSSYRLSQRAQLFYNISLCYQQMGDLDQSITYLERYLNEVPEIENRASLEQRLGNLRARRDAQGATTSDPPPDDTAAPEEAMTQPPPASSGDTTNVPAIVGFSIAGVGLIAGAIFSGLTLAEDGRIAALDCAGSMTCAASEVDTLSTLALVSDISWGVSLAGAIVGTIFLFVPTGSGSSDTQSIRVTPLLGQTSGFALEGSF